MADVSLIEFIPANSKIEANTLHDKLLENSFLNKFNAIINISQGTIENTKWFRWKYRYVTYQQQVRVFTWLDLENFIGKKYCETRKRDMTNYCDSIDLSASEEVESSPNRSTKYGTFENSPSSAFYVDIDTQFDKDICCENCRESRRGKSYEILEHGFIKYLIDQIEFLREEIKAKNKQDNLFTLKLSLRDEQNFSYKNIQINKSSNEKNCFS